jgi:hypothetical protein
VAATKIDIPNPKKKPAEDNQLFDCQERAYVRTVASDTFGRRVDDQGSCSRLGLLGSFLQYQFDPSAFYKVSILCFTQTKFFSFRRSSWLHWQRLLNTQLSNVKRSSSALAFRASDITREVSSNHYHIPYSSLLAAMLVPHRSFISTLAPSVTANRDFRR